MLLKQVFLLLIFAAVIITAVPAITSAQALNISNINGFINQTGETSGTKSDISLPQAVAKIVQILLGLVGIVFVILIIWGGVRYMTSMGDENKIKSAKNTLTLAIIGFVIILTAYAIASFIVSTLETSLK